MSTNSSTSAGMTTSIAMVLRPSTRTPSGTVAVKGVRLKLAPTFGRYCGPSLMVKRALLPRRLRHRLTLITAAEARGEISPGDTLVVASLDRLSRSLQDLISIVADLRERGVGFKSLHEQLDTTTPGGRLIFHVFAALAEFIRELIVEGTREGLDAARARGRVGGRPTVMTPEKLAAARALLPDNSVSAIARIVGVSRGTLYAHMDAIQSTQP